MAFTASMLVALTLTGGPTVDATARLTMAAASTPSASAVSLRGARLAPTRREAWMLDRPTARPVALPVLYAALGAVQAFDVYSTRHAISTGAHEVNPLMRGGAGSSATMIAVKALSTAGTIYFTERSWKKNRTGAVILMVAINGVTAAVAAHNIRIAR